MYDSILNSFTMSNIKKKIVDSVRQHPGTLIVLEGIDGSGKTTQSKLLVDYLRREEKNVKVMDFPRYDKQSSALVKMYLNGEFGDDPKAVSPYQASIFYAVDRFAAKKEMEEHLAAGGIIISNRYATANAIHQAGKIAEPVVREAFLEWLDELEYELFGIPRPDVVLFFDVPEAVSQQLVAEKQKRAYLVGEVTHDIHERDVNHLKDARTAARYVAKREGWLPIQSFVDGSMKSVEDIHEAVLLKLKPYLS